MFIFHSLFSLSYIDSIYSLISNFTDPLTASDEDKTLVVINALYWYNEKDYFFKIKFQRLF